jgi:hypothetical protein
MYECMVSFAASFEAVQNEARKLLRILPRRDLVSAERYRRFDASGGFFCKTFRCTVLSGATVRFQSWATLKAFLIVRNTRRGARGTDQTTLFADPKRDLFGVTRNDAT